MIQVAFLGASRGLGAAVVRNWQERHPDHETLVVARRPEGEGSFSCDFSKENEIDRLMGHLEEDPPQRLFYFAGGGPFGDFGGKQWKDHQWALQVSLLSPLKLLHWAINSSKVEQFVVVGSSVAESQPDPKASSYASAKHGLVGALSSIHQENPNLDARLFSPGYMDTEMLPANSRPRMKGVELLLPEKAANQFVDWVLDVKASWHLRLP